MSWPARIAEDLTLADSIRREAVRTVRRRDPGHADLILDMLGLAHRDDTPDARTPTRRRKIEAGDVADLVDSYRAGVPRADIAARYGVRVQAVTYWARKMGVPRRGNGHQARDADGQFVRGET